MHNFEYYTPTKVVFGKNTEAETGKLVKSRIAGRCSSTMETEALSAPVC